jgi:hypothetical protein
MTRSKPEQAWWQLPKPQPRRPSKPLLIAGIAAFAVWFVFLLVIALRAGN